MPNITVQDVLTRIKSEAETRDRCLIAIAGPPGSGKSTLAETLADRLGSTAAVLPMDGFHMDNDRLDRMGLLARKGAPETFDAGAFVSLIRAVRRGESVSYPVFDRNRDTVVVDGGQLTQASRIVLVEGNYLLLADPPWSELSELFDLTIALTVAREELERRLTARWIAQGLSRTQAETRMRQNDLRNAETVLEGSRTADLVVSNPMS